MANVKSNPAPGTAEADLVAFDLDGVIVDTEPLHKNAKIRILAEIGCLAAVDFDALVGYPNGDFWEEIVALSGTALTPKQLETRQYDYILEQMRGNHTAVNPDLPALLDALAGAGIGCGVCSSSDQYYVDRVLDFLGLTGRFMPVVAGDTVAAKKPAPDGYLKLVADASLPPGRVVAIEDSRAGVAAATGAGLRCIGYINPTSGDQDLTAAFLRVDTLRGVIDWLGL